MSENQDNKNDDTIPESMGKDVKEPKQKNLIIPVEEYVDVFTKSQKAALREQSIGRFPNLFDIRGFDKDILSKHPLIEMTNEAMLYTALFEETLKAKLKQRLKKSENKKKKQN